MSDIEELLDRLTSLNFGNTNSTAGTEEKEISVNMPNTQGSQAVNWDLFRSKLQNIKNFDGDSNCLNKFLLRCENLIDTYKHLNDSDLNKHIFECINGKLVGKAEILVGNRAELTDWNHLKAALIQCFSDRRDIDCLVQELTRTRPYKGEHLLDFGSRLQLLRSNVVQRISNDTSLSQTEKLCHISHYDKTALTTFIAGCTGTLKMSMHLKSPQTLEDAMAYANEFENFERLYGNLGNVEKPFRPPPVNKPINFQTMPNYNQNFNMTPANQNYSNQNYKQHNFSMPSPRPVFPSGPINIQPRHLPPVRYPTNRDVFGPPKNAFKPNQTPSHQLPKPTPMSVVSRYTNDLSKRKSLQMPQNSNNHFQRPPWQNQKPNFIVEELYSQETGENPPEIYQSSEIYEDNQNLNYTQENYPIEECSSNQYDDYLLLDYNNIEEINENPENTQNFPIPGPSKAQT